MPEDRKIIIDNQRDTVAVRKKAVQEILQRLELITSDDWAEITDRVFAFGKPLPPYVKCLDTVKGFIEKNKIRPIDQVKLLRERWWLNGGMFVELKHVHINDNIYILNDAQLESLDQELIRGFKISLKKAGEVKF